MTQGVFDVLCGVEKLNMEDTQFEFAAFVIAKYKESGGRLTELTEVPEGMQGSIDVLAFVGADLESVDLTFCTLISGKFPGGFFCDQFRC